MGGNPRLGSKPQKFKPFCGKAKIFSPKKGGKPFGRKRAKMVEEGAFKKGAFSGRYPGGGKLPRESFWAREPPFWGGGGGPLSLHTDERGINKFSILRGRPPYSGMHPPPTKWVRCVY